MKTCITHAHARKEYAHADNEKLVGFLDFLAIPLTEPVTNAFRVGYIVPGTVAMNWAALSFN